MRLEGFTGEVCLPAPRGTGYFGHAWVTVPGDEQVTLDTLVLIDAENLELRAAYLVPTKHSGMGTSTNPKREARSMRDWRWDQRVTLSNAAVDRSSPRYSVTVKVSTPGHLGRSRGIRITYHTSSDSFVTELGIGYILKKGRKCTAADVEDPEAQP